MALMEAGRQVLILKRASASRSSGYWSDDDFDVLANGEVVGRIFKANAAPVGEPWMWTLAFGHHEDRTPTHGYAATREAAMAAFANWLRFLKVPGNLSNAHALAFKLFDHVQTLAGLSAELYGAIKQPGLAFGIALALACGIGAA